MKKIAAMVLGCGLVGIASHAVAGYKQIEPLTVGSTTMSGTLGDVRNSADNTQYLEFDIRGFSGGAFVRTATGVTKMCSYSNRENFSMVLASVTPASLVQATWDAAGNCILLTVVNSSRFRPMTP